MKPKGRLGLVGWQKAVLWTALIVCIWRFLQVPVIFDALLKFYAAGEVPGTDIVLSPDAALWFVFITSALGAVILFIKLFIVRPRRPATYTVQHTHAETQPVVSLKPLPVLPPQPAAPVAPATAVAIARPKTARPARITPLLRSARARITGFTAAASRRIGRGIARGLTVVRPRLAAAARMVRRYSAVAFRFAKKYTILAAAFGALLLVNAWDWAKPYIHRFDTWLEVRLNQNEISATVLDTGRRVLGAVADIWRRATELTDRRQQPKER